MDKNFDRFTITMEEFLIQYLGLDYMDGTESFENLKKCSHQDLSNLGIEGVKRVPFDYVSISDLMEGNILLVKSGKKKSEIAPYIRPSLLFEKQNKTR